MQAVKLSVVINTKNVEDTLKRTLESIKFADEIVIVDMHSTDKTVELARQFTKQIFQHEDLGYADPARNFALSKASHDWILVIDADEVVTDELKKIILDTIAQAEAADVYWLPRKNMVFGHWIAKTGWWPDHQPRLFKKGTVSWQVGVHRLPDVRGKEIYFPEEEKFALLHFNYDDINHFIEKLNHYTTIQAKERPQLKEFSSAELLERFAGEFAKRSLMMNGVEEGMHGVSLSLLQAMYESAIYLKQWGNQGFKPTQPEDLGEALQKVQQVWRYWWADYQVRNSRGLKRVYWQVRRKFKI
ncbi:MAG: glycosyltransferase family 2 protein [Candidatus Paceibacterota bacterium]